MNLTNEQQEIINYIKLNKLNHSLLKVNSVAGSGKTTLLLEIVKTFSSEIKGLYLAYNRVIANEAKNKFPLNIECKTTHSMAYHALVKPNELEVGYFYCSTIREQLPYKDKLEVVEWFKNYCLSKYTSIEEMYEYTPELDELTAQYIKHYYQLMCNHEIPCTHDFYLKEFHIELVNKELDYKEFDIIMLDESGDLNPVTLEIFKLLPAKIKVMVGDQYQNIHRFNNTINCFDEMLDRGIEFRLTQSFRTDKNIANKIELFCRKYLDSSIKFKGIEIENSVINTKAILTRTNATLISKMIELNALGTSYKLVSTPKKIFELPILLNKFNSQYVIASSEHKHLQVDLDTYYSDAHLQSKYATILIYLLKTRVNDSNLCSAIKLIFKFGAKELRKCYKIAVKKYKTESNLTISTSHSAKGLEFDEVTIAEDLNTSIKRVLEKMKRGLTEAQTEHAVEELSLYYVACSRTKKKLINAKYL